MQYPLTNLERKNREPYKIDCNRIQATVEQEEKICVTCRRWVRAPANALHLHEEDLPSRTLSLAAICRFHGQPEVRQHQFHPCQSCPFPNFTYGQPTLERLSTLKVTQWGSWKLHVRQRLAFSLAVSVDWEICKYHRPRQQFSNGDHGGSYLSRIPNRHPPKKIPNLSAWES